MPYQPITEEIAREIVLTRLLEPTYRESLSSMEDFAKELYQAGTTDRVYSVRTLADILNGKTFPQLKDRDGHPFKWKDVPRRQRGRYHSRKRGMVEDLQHLKERVNFLYRHLGINPDLS